MAFEIGAFEVWIVFVDTNASRLFFPGCESFGVGTPDIQECSSANIHVYIYISVYLYLYYYIYIYSYTNIFGTFTPIFWGQLFFWFNCHRENDDSHFKSEASLPFARAARGKPMGF